MIKKDKKYLKTLINSVIYIPEAFLLPIDGNQNKYIFSAFGNASLNEYFSISVIYDAIIDLDKKIKLSFFESLKGDMSESLKDWRPFSKLEDKEYVALYHIENMIYRINILWDLLAQLCNIMFNTGLEIDKINHFSYFQQFSREDDIEEILKEIKNYINEIDNLETSPWLGNYIYLREYRNQMTHKINPSITHTSDFGINLRPPLMYLLHRATEDYYKVSSFICQLINNYLRKKKDWNPFNSSSSMVKND